MMRNKKIVIAGGMGFIGRAVTEYFGTDNTIVILSRSKHEPPGSINTPSAAIPGKNIRVVPWNGREVAAWVEEMEGCDMVINLAGKSINCRYTEATKKELIDSRVHATTAIGLAISQVQHPPKLWLNAASATIYQHMAEGPQDEYTNALRDNFSTRVSRIWEETFFNMHTPATRKAVLRMPVVLGAHGGVMIPYCNLVRFGLGGRQGSGRQMCSWVHIADVCRVIEFLWEHQELEGAFNVAAPGPITNAVFMEALRTACGVKFGLPSFEWMIKIGGLLIGTEASLVLDSSWVLPARLREQGFQFQFSNVAAAFADIISKMPRRSNRLW